MLKKSLLIFVALLTVGLSTVSAQDTTRLQQLEREMTQLTADFQAGKITAQQYQQRMTAMMQEFQTASNATANAQRQQIEQASSAYRYTDAQMRRLLEIYDQSNMIMANYNEKRITEADAARQTEPLKREIEQINAPFANLSREQSAILGNQSAELEKQLKQMWPGAIMGMPPLKGAFPNDERDRNYMEVGDLTRPIRQMTNTKASYSCLRGLGRIVAYDIYLTGTGANQAALENLKRQIEAATGKTMERNQRGDGYYLEFIDNRTKEVEPPIRYFSQHALTLRDGTIQYQLYDGAYDYGPDTVRGVEH